MVVEQVVFYSSITSANQGGGAYVCADSTNAGGVQNHGKHADIILERSLRLLLGNGASLEAFVALKTSNLVFRPKNLKVVKDLKSIQSGDRNFYVQGLKLWTWTQLNRMFFYIPNQTQTQDFYSLIIYKPKMLRIVIKGA